MMKNYQLPLFPLNLVICPSGLLPLRIFEARYLDMVKTCLKEKSQFAVVTVFPKGKNNLEVNFPFANIGTSVEIIDFDVSTVGTMNIRCIGHHRVKVNTFTQREDGLIVGDVTDVDQDVELPIPEDLEFSSSSLKCLIESLPSHGVLPADIPVNKPYNFNDAAWVANRWVELLNLPLLQKQRLMQQDSPIVRLELIHDILIAQSPKPVN
jgi:uncharacterized protein